ncbi:MAG: polyprenyl synthetase family protein [Tannerella sp.]|jgi:geranylgeranyl diphosphate synthase type II|nr:polyprenyl synthetase family protein [Tannerella sp.]
MLSVEQISERVESEISKIDFEMSPQCLFEPIKYILALGGKRIRPSMTIIASNIYNDNIEKAIKPALGMEVFHNFTLLHDDLMDQADKRRNKPTVHKKWNTNTAILSGDAMVIAAYQLIGETSEPHLNKILNLFSQTALEICCGQQYDMDFEKRNDVTEDEYIEMIRLKTAVLMACCLKTGAIIGGAPDSDAEHLYNFGIHIGSAFQLQDDLLDVYGNTETFGKNIGGDILCNKKTFLFINAISLAGKEQKDKMEYFKNPLNTFTPDEKIKAYTDIYDQLNIKDITQQKINNLYELAMNELSKLNINTASLSELKKFCNLLMLRES